MVYKQTLEFNHSEALLSIVDMVHEKILKQDLRFIFANTSQVSDIRYF